MKGDLLTWLGKKPVIPSARNMEDYHLALANTDSPCLFLLFGNINVMPELLALARQYHKRVMVHVDLMDGVGKDKAGIGYLARLGVPILVTTKSQLVKYGHESGLVAIQRLFLMDSEALRSGIKLIHGAKPDAVEILPACVPAHTIQALKQAIDLPVLGGGLMQTRQDIASALHNGVYAVSTSKRELWDMQL